MEAESFVVPPHPFLASRGKISENLSSLADAIGSTIVRFPPIARRADVTLTRFKASLAAARPPAGLPAPLEALWWQAKGDWDKAHKAAQADDGKPSAWAHAYLHRVEGDLGNAARWYRRAGRKAATGSLEAEWTAIVAELL